MDEAGLAARQVLAQLADRLEEGQPLDVRPGDGAAIWDVVRTAIEARLNPDGVDQALALLTVLDQSPPCAWLPEALDGLKQLRARAARLKQVAAETTTTQPADRAARRPS